MNINELSWQQLAVLTVAIVLIWLLVVKPVLKGNLSSEDEETKDIKGISKGVSPESGYIKAFDKTYFAKVAKIKKKKPTELLKSYGVSSSQLIEDAKALKAAKGVFNDDEELVYNIIASYPNIYTLSCLSFTFHHLYKTELASHLKSFLNESEFLKVVKIVNKKK